MPMARPLNESAESRWVHRENDFKQAAETALRTASKKGVEAEAFLLYNRELSIDVNAGEVDTLKEAEEIGMGLRVFNKGRLGFAYSSDLSERALQEMVQDAVNISGYTAADPYNCLPEPADSYPILDIYDPLMAAAPLEQKIELARATERAARAYDPRIKLVERAGYEDVESLTIIMNTNGLMASARANYTALYISLVAQDETDSQTAFAVMGQKKIVDLDPLQVGQEAASRAARSLQAKTVASAQLPCIMEPYVVTRFMGLLASSLMGDLVLKGKSRLEGKLGDQVAAPMFNLVDDGSLAGGIASLPFDGEGVATRSNSLIKDGCLQAFLYDHYSGLKAGQRSSGNGQRASFRSLPSVGTTNLMINPGSLNPEELMHDMKVGILITEVMGMHTANPISGDFSLGASGIMIRAGQLAEPVRGITIAGNLHTWLKDIEALGSDLRYYGAKAAPSIRLKSISVGGH